MGRAYQVKKPSGEDAEYPSVTTVTDLIGKGNALTQWAANCACDYIKQQIKGDGEHVSDEFILEILTKARFEWQNVSREALDIGTEVHKQIHWWIKSKGHFDPHNKDEQLVSAMKAFIKWQEDNSIEWLETELKVTSHKYGYAGTLDAVCDIDGKIYILDFKSSKGFYDGYGKQVAAYRHAYEETLGHGVDGMGVLRLDKTTGIPEFKDYSNKYDKTINAFLKLLKFYYADKKRRLKNNNFVIK